MHGNAIYEKARVISAWKCWLEFLLSIFGDTLSKLASENKKEKDVLHEVSIYSSRTIVLYVIMVS